MNARKSIRRGSRPGLLRRGAVLVSAMALLANMLVALGAPPTQKKKRELAGERMSEAQRIVHVLNRLAFGPRPGEVERIRVMGVERYIEQQLDPESIDDAASDARIKKLSVPHLSTGELLARYPNPGRLIRQLQRRGELPPELARFVESRDSNNQAMLRRNGAAAPPPAMEGADAMRARPGETIPDARRQQEMEGGKENVGPRDYRRAMAEYMRANNLGNPQLIMAELQAARILRAVYSERQLQEVMVDFWTNHFNVFAGKGLDRWFLPAYDRDTLRPHALGKFRNLLGATAESPAMLFYLDNFQSVSPHAPTAPGRDERRRQQQQRQQRAAEASSDTRDSGLVRLGRERVRPPRPGEVRETSPPPQPQQMPVPEESPRPPRPARQRRGINENYARELMELHTLGVDGGYTQKDVQEVARAFTGWTITDPQGAFGGERAGQFHFNARLHDDGEKIVLGQRIPAGGGIRDGEIVLDILSRHPSTAKFIAAKLCRRFVSDTPPPALVERVAQVFTKSDGDIKQILRAIFTAPEFNSVEFRRAKIKTPFELAVSAIRAIGAETDARPALHQWIAKMGEGLYLFQAPTGYPDTSAAWVNTGALLERLNFTLALTSNSIPGTRVDLARFAAGGGGSSGSVDQTRVIDHFLQLMLQGDVSPKTKETLMNQLSGAGATAPPGSPSAAATTASTPIGAPAGEATSGGGAANDQMRNALDVYGRRGARRGGGAARRAQHNSPNSSQVARIAALILGTPEFQRQ